MTTDFEKPGTLPRPGLVGRTVRIALGVLTLSFFILTLTNFRGLVSPDFPRHPLLWLGVAVSFYLLPGNVNIGFTRNWGQWSQPVVVLLALVAVGFDILQYGSAWGPVLGMLVFLLLAYVTGHLGLSFFLGGVLATPG